MNIEKLLKQHKENKARIDVLNIKIEKAKEELHMAKTTYEENEDEAIEALQISAVTIKDTPSAKTNEFNSAVENTVINYHDERNHKNNPDIEDIYSNISTWEKELEGLKAETGTIETALKGLTAQEKFVIEMYYFEKIKGTDLQISFEKTFRYKSQETIRDIRSEALKKIEKLVA